MNVAHRQIFMAVVFKDGRHRIHGDVLADLLVLQAKLEVFLHLLESTFRVELARPEECHKKDVCLGRKGQVLLGCN